MVWGIVVIIIVGVLFYAFHNPNTYSSTANESATSTDTAGGVSGTNMEHRVPGGKPIVTTAGFASVSSTTAVVVGTVIPNGAATTYWFEYGPDMKYGSIADAVSAAPSYKEIGAAAYITGLKPNTEYYFRIGAKNAYGTTYGGQYKLITKNQ